MSTYLGRWEQSTTMLEHSFSLKALDTSDRWRANSMRMQRESTARFFKSGSTGKEGSLHHGLHWWGCSMTLKWDN